MYSSMSSCTSKETTQLLPTVHYWLEFMVTIYISISIVLSMCPSEVSQMVGRSEQAVQCMALVKETYLYISGSCHRSKSLCSLASNDQTSFENNDM